MWIDTHAHIYLDEFRDDRDEMLERARTAGIERILMPNIDHTSIDSMLSLEDRGKDCVAMMGLHPCSVKRDFEKELYEVEEWLTRRRFCAIGEMGTDLYWDKTFWEQQKEAFTIQVGWAKKFKLPIVIHCRESIDETIELLQTLATPGLGGVFHCFTGTIKQALAIIDLGFYLGIGGVATFKNGGLDKVLPGIDADHIIMETDSPYLAPVPHRGKRNEPGYIPLIADKVSGMMNITTEELSVKTTANARKLFGHSLSSK